MKLLLCNQIAISYCAAASVSVAASSAGDTTEHRAEGMPPFMFGVLNCLFYLMKIYNEPDKAALEISANKIEESIFTSGNAPLSVV